MKSESEAAKPKWAAKQWADWLRNVTIIDNRVSILYPDVNDLVAALESKTKGGERLEAAVKAIENLFTEALEMDSENGRRSTTNRITLYRAELVAMRKRIRPLLIQGETK